MNVFFRLDQRRRRRPPTAVLGLALDGSRLDGVVVRRQTGALLAAQSFSATLSLDPLNAAPELVGREILNLLEAAGIRERQCAVALPLKWVLTAHTRGPPLPAADLPGFLLLEAERGFPCDAATLRVVTSRYAIASGEAHATFVGIPSAHVERLAQALRAARLQPLRFSLGAFALQPPTAGDSRGTLALMLGESHAALQVTCGGGVAALRALDGITTAENGRRTVLTELLAREVRITLGQLSPDCRAAIARIRIFGPAPLARQLAADLAPLGQALSAIVEPVLHYAESDLGARVAPDVAPSPAFSLAAQQLADGSEAFDFLPPYVSPWMRLVARYASGRWRAAGLTAAAVLLLTVGLFGAQECLLLVMRARWGRIERTVGELQAVQQQIRQYRPWYDESFVCLTLLRELSLAFPEDGAVTAKSIEVHDASQVSCSGTARDNPALLQTLTRLRAVSGVHNLRVEQIRGKTPLQFTFSFQYGQETSREN